MLPLLAIRGMLPPSIETYPKPCYRGLYHGLWKKHGLSVLFFLTQKKKKTPPTVGVVVAVVAPWHVHHLVRHADVLGVGPKVFRRGHGHELHRPLLPERLVRLGYGQDGFHDRTGGGLRGVPCVMRGSSLG